jgi:uncharacterized protein (TIGR02599 family)
MWPNRDKRQGFTLIEILVSMAVLALLLGFLFAALDNSSRLLGRANEQIEAFQEARTAFDSLARSLRSATLNTYWDYDDPNQPQRYIRQSELHFVIRPGDSAGAAKDGVFFPSSRSYNQEAGDSRALTNLLNTCGFYVEFGPDAPPGDIPARQRYRLKQLLLPGSDMRVFSSTGAQDFGWFTDYLGRSVTLAENIILLRAWPRSRVPLDPDDPESDSLTTDYGYNSRKNAGATPQPLTANQMPPLIDLTMVAIDETSAQRVGPSVIAGALAGLFETSTRTAYDQDMQTLETRLSSAQPPVSYRIFRATLPIEESKWSKD